MTAVNTETPIIYPNSDGKPMADNTLQFDWIVTIKGGLEAFFRDNPDVFVGGDLLWYPVEGDNKTRIAPDILVVFGRPKGYRGSYRQWQEGGIAPQLVFEILSPGNRPAEMRDKFNFYERLGVEEYYIYDPEKVRLRGWRRSDVTKPLQAISDIRGWVSPRLKIRFELELNREGELDLKLYRPDGRNLATYLEMDEQRSYAEQQQNRAEQQQAFAEQQLEQERRRSEQLEAQLKALLLGQALPSAQPKAGKPKKKPKKG